MPEKLSLTHSVDELRAYLGGFNALPFVTHTGVRAEVVDEFRVRVVLDPVEAIHRGGIQGSAVNGGTLASVFDLALGLPGLLRAFPEARTATVQLSMSFLRAVRGQRVQTDAWIVRATTGLLFTQAETLDDQGNVCATAQGVVRMMEGYSTQREY